MAPAALAFAAWLAAGAMAAAQTPTERAAFESAVSRYVAGATGGPISGLFTSLPPRFMEDLARENGTTVGGLLAAMEAAEAELSGGVTIEEFTLDAEAAELSGSGDDAYALVPMVVVGSAQGAGRISARGAMVGVVEDGEWYFVYPNSTDALERLTRVYPHLSGVEIPGTDMTMERTQ